MKVREAPIGIARIRPVIVILASLTLLITAGWSATRSKGGGVRVKLKQQGTAGAHRKVVDQGIMYPNQPIEITEVVTGDGRVAKLSEGIKFDPETEWLKGLSWNITNLSQKNILAIDLFVMFPDTEVNGNRLLAYPMHYGADPQLGKSPSPNEPTVKPSEKVRFVISDDIYRKIKPHLEAKVPLVNVNHVRIHLELIVFADDTAWGGGQEMRRDPGNPRRWIPIE